MDGYGIAFGALLGLLVGVFLDQLAYGLLFGAVLGLVIGMIYDKKKSN